MRIVFSLAALYNLGFAIWLWLHPLGPFELLTVPSPWEPFVSQFLALGIGAFGLGYAYATVRPERARPIIAFGILAKSLPPLAWVYAASFAGWPLSSFFLFLANDLVWLWPFWKFLRSGEKR